ncbi:type III pantothenate kinase [Spirosoma daeguense]
MEEKSPDIGKPLKLVIDWGNSSLKTGWFDGSDLIETRRYSSTNELLLDLPKRSIDQVIVSSTSRPGEELRSLLPDIRERIWILDSQTVLPIRKSYDTPDTLGADRVAAAAGAITLFPGESCLVLDLGTCLTADFVDRDATFQGGLISPGLRMRFRAMHEQTARLPMINVGDEDVVVNWPVLEAKNTRQAMLSGVLNGLLFEMNGIIEDYRKKWPNVVVLVCGGDASLFESRLKPPIFVVPELVLMGLNRILRHNVDNLQAGTPENLS